MGKWIHILKKNAFPSLSNPTVSSAELKCKNRSLQKPWLTSLHRAPSLCPPGWLSRASTLTAWYACICSVCWLFCHLDPTSTRLYPESQNLIFHLSRDQHPAGLPFFCKQMFCWHRAIYELPCPHCLWLFFCDSPSGGLNRDSVAREAQYIHYLALYKISLHTSIWKKIEAQSYSLTV